MCAAVTEPVKPAELPALEGLEGLSAGARVVVAMSGGVDSSVTAAALKAAGFEVVGITLQLYDHGAAVRRPGACCAGEDIRDARRVAESLGIAHYVLDYEQRFKASVIDDFADSYLAGETPVPCIRCNQRVKFADLLDMARELGAAALVTGHYARRLAGRAGAELHRAVDEARDQSYFLFATTREQLEFLRFPLGALSKTQTRALAQRFGLGVADKQDSQDICFVPSGKYSDVIERLRPGAAEPGDIVDLEGNVLGRHDGVIHYTVGQRRGLGLATGEPLFVVKLDAARRQVIVGPREALLVHRIEIGQINWLGDAPLAALGEGLDVLAKVRSTRPAVPGRICQSRQGFAEVTLEAGEEGVAPGQACVLYGPDGSRVLGGGFICASGATQARQ
jgi:tRNA-specific 2-thiouridylase